MPRTETTRTSFELSRRLLARAKARAFDERRDLKDLIADALRRYLADDKSPAARRAKVAERADRPARRRVKRAVEPVDLETLRQAMSGL